MFKDIQTKLNTMFSDLFFDEQRHLYFLDGVNIPSVSKLVESHAEKFNADKMLGDKTLIQRSAYKASREEGREVTEHELRHRWQTKNKEACDLGHETHDYLEYYEGLKTPTTPQQEAGVKYLKDIDGRYVVLCRELRMYSREYQYAGTTDLVLWDNYTQSLVLADYKTNGDLFKTYGWLKQPFEYLESHPYNKYQLQLSYYQIMLMEGLEKAGLNITVSDRHLVYLKADATFRVFPTVDFTTDLRANLANQKQPELISSEIPPLTKWLW